MRTASEALPRPEKSMSTASEDLPRPEKSVCTASDGPENSTSGGPAGQPPPEGKVHGGVEGHSVEPQPVRDDAAHKYTKVDKSRKNTEDNVPVFESLYQSSSSEEDKTKHGTSATS